MNNSSLLTADRTTHLKIVLVSLVFATLVAGVGIAARLTDGKMGLLEASAPTVKAPKPITAAADDQTTVR